LNGKQTTGANAMNTTNEVREIEKHIKSLATTKEEQIAIISKAQSMTIDNERHLSILAIVKNRIIHS
jgi:copper chaperone CopZ